jgi:choline dehydrogenase-like flavoprotein
MTHYDGIIIGTAAGGGTLARQLAPSGKRVLLLERGGWLPREPENISAAEVFVNNRYVSADTWRYRNGEEFQPQIHYCLGGATKLYGAAPYRLREEDFGELRHHDGISPAWPIGYDELEPYYTLAEQLYCCSNCDGFPCIVHAKSDAEVLGVRPALEHDNVELLIDAEAVRLNTDSAGATVSSVVINHGGNREELTADFVVVCCGAANSARLLLMSANERHPNGLANGSDQVGRNYMFHNSQAVLALSMEENPTIFQKTLGLNDFYLSGPDFENAGQHPDGRQVPGADVPR